MLNALCLHECVSRSRVNQTLYFTTFSICIIDACDLYIVLKAVCYTSKWVLHNGPVVHISHEMGWTSKVLQYQYEFPQIADGIYFIFLLFKK